MIDALMKKTLAVNLAHAIAAAVWDQRDPLDLPDLLVSSQD
ncbi:hypothetical protein [Lacrimispora sp.]